MIFGSSNWSAAFEKVALRFGGNFASKGLFRLPAANFSYRQAACRVQCVRRRWRGKGKSTEMRVAWPLRSFRMEVRRLDAEPRSRSLRYAAVVEDGLGEGKLFRAVSNNPEIARKLLSDGVRWQIDQLARMRPEHSLWVTIDRGWMTVARSGYLRQPEAVDDFVRYTLELYDQLLLTMSAGIDFHDNVVGAVEELQCPVCSSDIDGEMVLCLRCKTPHCHDCWMYNGKCGMYACNETRFSRLS